MAVEEGKYGPHAIRCGAADSATSDEEEDVVEGFSHLVLAVSDLDRSEAWYRDVVGLDVVGRNLLAESQPHALLRMNTGQLLVLMQVEQPEPIRPQTAAIHHAFLLELDEYVAMQERLSAAGYDVTDQRAAFRAKGEFSTDATDPDGHRWQLQAFGEEAHTLLKPGLGVVECGPVEQFAVGSVTTFREGNFFLVRDRKGFLALSRWCRHMNGLLSNQREHQQLFCAFHGATYNYAGHHTGHLPNVGALHLNPVTIRADGMVCVDTDTVVEREPDEPPEYVPAPLASNRANRREQEVHA